MMKRWTNETDIELIAQDCEDLARQADLNGGAGVTLSADMLRVVRLALHRRPEPDLEDEDEIRNLTSRITALRKVLIEAAKLDATGKFQAALDHDADAEINDG